VYPSKNIFWNLDQLSRNTQKGSFAKQQRYFSLSIDGVDSDVLIPDQHYIANRNNR
jgi:hypothetical protein